MTIKIPTLSATPINSAAYATELKPEVSMVLRENIEFVLIDEETIQQRIIQLGEIINQVYKGKELLLVSVLKGSLMFMADLMRAIEVPHEVDFMAITSYGSGTTSSGVVRILKDLNFPIDGRNIIVVEDIIDSGRTLSYLLRILHERNPASIRVMTLLDKPDRREAEIDVDWVGFEVPNHFVVGYGLDYAEKYRNLPFIGVLKPCVYSDPELDI